MKKYVLLIVLSAFIYSCGFSQKVLKLSYKDGERKEKCQLELPKGLKDIKKIQSDDGHSEVRALMKDNSVIYITDDFESGSGIYDAKVKSYNDNISLKILTNDKIDIGGIYNDLYWREAKCGKIVCGYYNISQELKEQYDDIINAFIGEYCK